MSKPIEIQLDTTHFAPNSKVKGTILWQVSDKNKTLDLRLFWFTEGRGTQDVGIADELAINTLGNTQGEQEFTLQLPEAPVSFLGSLICLQWALEAEAIEDHDSERVEITVSLTDSEIELSPIAEPLTDKKKKRKN